MSKLPKLTTEPILHIDATPDNGYPLRILRAYRENCNCKWSLNTNGNTNSTVLDMMNKDQDKRAEILDKAIKILQEVL